MNAIIFAGPTVRKSDLVRLCDATILPPAAMGDIYRASRQRPRAIGIIDGYFEGAPSIWHKEILWAMAEGIEVFGAASMGALRAAELASFGMQGIGDIFAFYLAGRLEDDDEVAVEHGPGEMDYITLSEPLVNIRATIDRAVAEGIVTARLGRELTDLAKQQFYKERSWEKLLRLGDAAGMVLDAFAKWLPDNAVDLKRADALKMAAAMAEFLARPHVPVLRSFSPEWTVMWERATRSFIPYGEIAASNEESVSPSLVLEELRLDPDRYTGVRRSAIARKLIDTGSLPDHAPVDPALLRQELIRFRARNGLLTHSSLLQWLKENGLDATNFEKLLEDEIRLDMAGSTGRSLDGYILAELQLAGTYPALARRARQKQQVLDGDARPENRLQIMQARLWYFEDFLNRPVPDDIAQYARELGFAGIEALDRAVLREFTFQRMANEGRTPGRFS